MLTGALATRALASALGVEPGNARRATLHALPRPRVSNLLARYPGALAEPPRGEAEVEVEAISAGTLEPRAGLVVLLVRVAHTLRHGRRVRGLAPFTLLGRLPAGRRGAPGRRRAGQSQRRAGMVRQGERGGAHGQRCTLAVGRRAGGAMRGDLGALPPAMESAAVALAGSGGRWEVLAREGRTLGLRWWAGGWEARVTEESGVACRVAARGGAGFAAAAGQGARAGRLAAETAMACLVTGPDPLPPARLLGCSPCPPAP